QMEPQRAVYRQRAPYSPYQNQNPVDTIGKKKYMINAPRPGYPRANDFHGVATLIELKKSRINPKRSMLEDFPVLQSRNFRRVIKIIPRTVSDSTLSTVSVDDDIGAVQEVNTKGDGIMAELVKRKMSFGVSCSECSHPFHSRIQLCQHISTAHGIPAPVIQKIFKDDRSFRGWLERLKETNSVDFVHSSGSRNYRGREQKISYLQCSRSGDQKIIPSRNVKRPRGTTKCGKTCLAYLKVTQSLHHGRTFGPLKVEGCLQHSGHSIDAERILLTPEEQGAIQQLNERTNRNDPIDITMARAILYPCARFRLITDEQLLRILPKWIFEISDEEEREGAWTGNELEKEGEEEERVEDLRQSNTMNDPFQGLDQQILELEEDDDCIVSVV
ncbi:hypothetical protein PENTCL1PPCAC_6724, partial [Pristionchus entomophagus]